MGQQPKDGCEEGQTFCSIPLLLLHDVTSSLLLRAEKKSSQRASHHSSKVRRQIDRQRATLEPSLLSQPTLFSHRFSFLIYLSPCFTLYPVSISPLLPQKSLLITVSHTLLAPLPHHSTAPCKPLSLSLPFSVFPVPSDISCFHRKCFI